MCRPHPGEGRELSTALRGNLAALAVVALVGAGCATQNPALEPTPGESPVPVATEPSGEALADGRHFGYIRDVDGPARTLEFDLAFFLTGEEAGQAAVEDGEIEPGEDVPNDYYIVNRNPMLRTLRYATSVEIILVNWPDCCENPIVGEISRFAAAFAPGGKSDLYLGPESQYWITISGGTVTEIEELYLP